MKELKKQELKNTKGGIIGFLILAAVVGFLAGYKLGRKARKKRKPKDL